MDLLDSFLLYTFTLIPLNMTSKRQKTVVIGAGPVGALAALYAAQRGHEVEVYELRNGMFSFRLPLGSGSTLAFCSCFRVFNSFRHYMEFIIV